MKFITLQQVLDFHREIVLEYGGLDGTRDLGLLISALETPKATMFGESLYPTVFDKAAAYLFHIIRNHPFLDGNKRTGTMITLVFLEWNRVHLDLTEEVYFALEELVVGVAEGVVSKEQISSFFSALVIG
jgi:death-on-curing protein